MVLWVCLCPDWGFLECRDPTLVSSTVDAQGMSVEGMVNTCPYLHRGGGFLQVGAFNRGFLEETASELSLKAGEAGILQASRMESGNRTFREVSRVMR